MTREDLILATAPDIDPNGPAAKGGPWARENRPERGWIFKANQEPAYGCPCIHDSRRLTGAPKVRRVFEEMFDLASYLDARFTRRCFVKGSAFSASERQRSACSFKNELSTFDSNATG